MAKTSIQPEIEAFGKQAAQVQSKLREFVDKWHWLTTDYGWKFDVHYCMGAEDMPDEHQEATACAIWQAQYLRGDLYFNLRELRNIPDDLLEETVVHEITHLLLGPYSPEDPKSIEYVTTTVSRNFIKSSHEEK